MCCLQGADDAVPLSCCVLDNDDPVNPDPTDNKECQKDAREQSHDSDYVKIEVRKVMTILYSKNKAPLI